MFAQLGEVAFEARDSWRQESHSQTFNYAEYELIEGPPDLQFFAAGLREIELQMTLRVELGDPRQRWAKLAAAAEAGKVLPFVRGSGEYVGDFVIVELRQDVTRADPQGRPLVIEATVRLKEYIVEREYEIRERKR